MLSPLQVYPLVTPWLQSLGPQHRTAQDSLAQLVSALLTAQSLRPAALMRALPSHTPVPARQRYRRLERSWDRPWLSSEVVTPQLVQAALALVLPDPAGWPTAGLTHLALDSVRCGPWEVFTLGVVWHGRVLLVGWAVLPYPWPKGAFTPTVCALIRRVAQSWPAVRPVHLVADRGFPSREFFRTVRSVDWGWTVRLRARCWVTVDGQEQWVRSVVEQERLAGWRARPARFGKVTSSETGTLVVGRGLLVLPWHQRTAGSLRHRAAQAERRQQHVVSKHPGRQPDGSWETDRWVVLFSSHAEWGTAGWSYRRRWAIEGSYRDGQSGWDGKHGWDLEPVLARLTAADQVDRVVGLWALGQMVQTYIGDAVMPPAAPAEVRAVVREWTVSGRLSVWARGRLAFTDPTGRLSGWLEQTLQRGAERLRSGPLLPDAVAAPVRPATRRAAA